MPLTVGHRPVRPLTADEVLKMVELGVLAEGERVELLHGVLTQMSAQSEPHVALVQRLLRWLTPLVVGGRHDLRIQMPLRVPDRTSLPEPDVAVVERDDATIAHPATAQLVVEVAVTSLRTDLEVKPALYAAAGVPELWVVDAVARRLEVFTEPHAGGYARRDTVAPPEPARPRSVPAEPLDLAVLFAGLSEAG